VNEEEQELIPQIGVSQETLQRELGFDVEEEDISNAIDWKKIRDERVPPVSENDPALARIHAQLRWLDARHTLVGNDPTTGRPLAELHANFKQQLLDEIERYRWRKAEYEPTQEMLDACRDPE
jgi:hypothetical protein